MAADTLGSRKGHACLALGIRLVDGGLAADSSALCTWKLESECPSWQPAVGCMEVLAPTSSGATSPLLLWGSTFTFCVQDVIEDAGW